MEKCVACQFYDRKFTKVTDSRSPQWGQCRRTAPMLNPITAKSYNIEGVWPTVRDDDWCGEWKGSAIRRAERIPDMLTTPVVTGTNGSARVVPGIVATAAKAPGNGSALGAANLSMVQMTAGTGDD